MSQQVVQIQLTIASGDRPLAQDSPALHSPDSTTTTPPDPRPHPPPSSGSVHPAVRVKGASPVLVCRRTAKSCFLVLPLGPGALGSELNLVKPREGRLGAWLAWLGSELVV